MSTKVLTTLALTAMLGCSGNPEPMAAEPMPAEVTPTDTPAAPVASEAAAPSPAPTPEPAPAPPPEPAADIAVAPMKITLDAKTAMELKADKGIYTKGKKIAVFDKNLLQLVEMKDNLAVMKDGAVVTDPAMPKKVRFNDKDELEIEGGGKIAIDDKGTITMTPPDGKEAPKDFKPKITGFKPEARRAAMLTLFLGLMSTSVDKSQPPVSESGPPAPPPPPKK